MDRISALEKEISEIRQILSVKEKELFELKKSWIPLQQFSVEDPFSYGDGQAAPPGDAHGSAILPKWAIERYSRQILLPEIGVEGQRKLCDARVLIAGAGGLGCPSAVYLAAAGVGEISVVDYDVVELSNLHRQVLHAESDVSTNKAHSAAHTLRSLNSRVKITPHAVQLDSSNALELVRAHDVVLDCTDNVPTRYLLNDACVLAQVPLISGSALKLEGQLTIYGYRGPNSADEESNRGPCYRCVFPSPPPPAAVGSCSAHGVAGPVPAVIGALQAMEAIKYIVGFPRDKLLVGRLLLVDADDVTARTVRLRGRDPGCAVCSARPALTALIDYEGFCHARATEKDLDLQILPAEHRISATALSSELTTAQRHLLVDVRSSSEFRMCNIDGAVNYPIESFSDSSVSELAEEVKKGNTVTFVCRRGNDSQVAAERLQRALPPALRRAVRDLAGGLRAWAKHVDAGFPVY